METGAGTGIVDSWIVGTVRKPLFGDEWRITCVLCSFDDGWRDDEVFCKKA